MAPPPEHARTPRCRHLHPLQLALLEKLAGLGAELINMDSSGVDNKMSWRFTVASDPSVTRYIMRDVDSRLSAREKLAVDEWVRSGRKFHVMRDHPSHSKCVEA